ncbi:MAG: thermonuclease family protein [Ahrensia sp.]|nr:thermonuclease family protein [Ahrensia sp.]
MLALVVATTVASGGLVPATMGHATAHPCKGTKIADGRVVAVSTAQEFRLEGNRTTFALAGLVWTGEPQPLFGENVSLFSSNDRTDRYERRLVHAFSKSGVWLQGELLRAGKALQYGLGEAAECRQALSAAENYARHRGAGLWAEKARIFEANRPEKLMEQVGRFAIASGRIKSVGDRERALYLNFGSNWSEDVTAVAAKKGAGAFSGDMAMLRGLAGRHIEVRGIVENVRGPLIRLIDEAQIDILDRP